MLPGVNYLRDDFIHADSMLDLRKHERPVAPHRARVALHHSEVRADGGREVGFVDDEQVGLRDSRAALARDFVASGDVDYINRIIGQFPAEMRG